MLESSTVSRPSRTALLPRAVATTIAIAAILFALLASQNGVNAQSPTSRIHDGDITGGAFAALPSSDTIRNGKRHLRRMLKRDFVDGAGADGQSDPVPTATAAGDAVDETDKDVPAKATKAATGGKQVKADAGVARTETIFVQEQPDPPDTVDPSDQSQQGSDLDDPAAAAAVATHPSQTDLQSIALSAFVQECTAQAEASAINVTEVLQTGNSSADTHVDILRFAPCVNADSDNITTVDLTIRVDGTGEVGAVQLSSCDGTLQVALCDRVCSSTNADCPRGTLCKPSTEIDGYATCVAAPQIGENCSGDFLESYSAPTMDVDAVTGMPLMCDERQSLCIKDIDAGTRSVDKVSSNGDRIIFQLVSVDTAVDPNARHIPHLALDHSAPVKGTCERICQTDNDCSDGEYRWCKTTDKYNVRSGSKYKVCSPYAKTGEACGYYTIAELSRQCNFATHQCYYAPSVIADFGGVCVQRCATASDCDGGADSFYCDTVTANYAEFYDNPALPPGLCKAL